MRSLEMFGKGDNGKLIFLQNQIDADSAEKILSLNEEKLRAILKGNDDDPEHIEDDAIDRAVLRLNAMQEKITQLKESNQLIGGKYPKQWGTDTYNEAMLNGTKQAFNKTLEFNYLVRAQNSYNKAGSSNNPLLIQEAYG